MSYIKGVAWDVKTPGGRFFVCVLKRMASDEFTQRCALCRDWCSPAAPIGVLRCLRMCQQHGLREREDWGMWEDGGDRVPCCTRDELLDALQNREQTLGGRSVVTAPCRHKFHVACLLHNSQVNLRSECPIASCRQTLIKCEPAGTARRPDAPPMMQYAPFGLNNDQQQAFSRIARHLRDPSQDDNDYNDWTIRAQHGGGGEGLHQRSGNRHIRAGSPIEDESPWPDFWNSSKVEELAHLMAPQQVVQAAGEFPWEYRPPYGDEENMPKSAVVAIVSAIDRTLPMMNAAEFVMTLRSLRSQSMMEIMTRWSVSGPSLEKCFNLFNDVSSKMTFRGFMSSLQVINQWLLKVNGLVNIQSLTSLEFDKWMRDDRAERPSPPLRLDPDAILASISKVASVMECEDVLYSFNFLSTLRRCIHVDVSTIIPELGKSVDKCLNDASSYWRIEMTRFIKSLGIPYPPVFKEYISDDLKKGINSRVRREEDLKLQLMANREELESVKSELKALERGQEGFRI